MSKAGFATVNPSTGEEIETFSYFTPAQTDRVVARADKNFKEGLNKSCRRTPRKLQSLENGHTEARW